MWQESCNWPRSGFWCRMMCFRHFFLSGFSVLCPTCAHFHAYTCEDAVRHSVYHAIPSQLIPSPSSRYVRRQRNSVFLASTPIVTPLGKTTDGMHTTRFFSLCPLIVDVLGAHFLPALSFTFYLFSFIFINLDCSSIFFFLALRRLLPDI